VAHRNDRLVHAAIRWTTLFGYFLIAFSSPARIGSGPRQETSALHFPSRFAATNYVFEPVVGLPPLWCVAATSIPGETERMFFLNQAGWILSVTNLTQPRHEVFLDLSAKTYHHQESGLLGLAFHPDFRTNGWFFVFYTTFADGSEGPGIYDRLSRFQLDPGNPRRALPESEFILISQFDEDPNHNGGDLAFGPDGYLYVALGDEGGARDSFRNAAVLDGDFFSGILRIDVDRRPGNLDPSPHPAIHPGSYSIPKDNPFVGLSRLEIGGLVLRDQMDPEKLRTEFFAVGLRNPWRMHFDSRSGSLFCLDVGENDREEFNRIVPGGFYGWPFREGTLDWPWNVPEHGMMDPLLEYTHQNGRMAITGGLKLWDGAYPEFEGRILFSDLNGAVGVADPNSPDIRWIALHSGLIFSLARHPATGEILALDGTQGQLMVLKRKVESGPPLPARLSETGIFMDLKELQPQPGIVPYEINVPFWSDGALKQRWFALTNLASRFGFSTEGSWSFPVGTLWVKHFDLPLDWAAANRSRRLETRVLIRQAEGVAGASYRWNLEGSEAYLVAEEGLEENLYSPGQPRRALERWRFPSRLECQQCHTRAGGFALGFNTPQLNLWQTFDGVAKNQITELAESGYLDAHPGTPHAWWQLAAANNLSWSLEHRVRSYFAANCSSCHQPGAPSRSRWDARIHIPLSTAGLINAVPVASIASEETRIVAPGSLQHSVLYRRVAEWDGFHMPPLGHFRFNSEAIRLLEEWILEDLPSRPSYDAWHTEQFGGIVAPQTDWDGDLDQDGWINEHEFLLGTDPFDGHSSWRMEIIPGPAGVRIRYDRLPGLRFVLESSTSLTPETWRPVEHPANRPFVGAVAERVEVELPASYSGVFFRMKILVP